MSLAEQLRETPTDVASIIDHTNVDPAATEDEIRTLCAEVREYGFCSAVVVPYHAPLAAELLSGEANVVPVIGFPYGIQNAAAKREEVREHREHVDEIDMVMNRTAFANGNDELVVSDIEAVVEAAGDIPVKCIIESPLLSREEITRAATLVEEGGAAFVKTAVGYDGPTDPDEVVAIREGVSNEMQVKASGGIGSFEEVLTMVEAGANRIGASAGVEICESVRSDSSS